MKRRFIGMLVGLAVVPLAAAGGGSSVFAASPQAVVQSGPRAIVQTGPQEHHVNPPAPKPPAPKPISHPVNPGGQLLPLPHIWDWLPGHHFWGWYGHRDWAPGHHPEPRRWTDHDNDWNYWYGQGFHDGWLDLHHRHDLGGEHQQAYDRGYSDGDYASDHD